jgi:hypothetical protein
MSTSWKCAECGLVNFAADLNCKRCGAAAAAAGVQTTPLPTGIVLEDGYVLPPPPSTGSGVWRDGKTLIMTKDASLPDQCVKCNAPANGFRLKRNLSWHHPAIYLVILVAWIIYIVLAIALSKRATVFFGLCTEHYNRRRGLLIVGWIMLALGLITPVVAFSNNYPEVGLLGILLLLVSVFWLVFASRVVKVKKIDDRLIWLTGIDPNYLAQFPPWQSQP